MNVLREVVAEKTGYPVEMLELDMQLDADLGIDSIKRVEILSSVQDRFPAIRTIGPEHTAALQTLREIAAFLSAPIGAAATPSPAREHGELLGNGQNGKLVHASGHTTSVEPSRNGHGHPDAQAVVLRRLEARLVPMSTPDRREALRLPAGGTFWITDDGSALTDALCSLLLDRGYRPRVIPMAVESVDPPVPEDNLSGVIVLSPSHRPDSRFIPAAFRTIRAAGTALERSGEQGGAALLTVSRLDGQFGFHGLEGRINPSSGALAGLAKTAAKEWPRVHCKAVDLDVAMDSPESAAGRIVDELLMRGPAEVGLGAHGRVTLEMAQVPEPVANLRRIPRLECGDLVVVTGGARGITAEVAVALAESYQPRLLVLGRTPAPDDGDDRFEDCRDEVEVTRLLMARSDRDRSPRAIAAQAREVVARREIRRNLSRIAAAGSPALYRSVNVRDQAAVRRTIAWSRDEFGPVRGLIHGAGVLADRRIVDQTDAQFQEVLDTKVEGLLHLFEAIDPEALRVLALFSSSTARFGRIGQVAYAAANEYLNKWAQQAAVHLPHCRVVSFNWGPWSGGMVSSALRPMFEKEGLTLIPPEAGAKLVLDEIDRPYHGRAPVEIVVLAEPASSPIAPSAPSSTTVADPGPQKPQVAFRRAINLETLPILADHVIDGHAVLPMAMILEWAAEAALHRNPGLVVCGVQPASPVQGGGPQRPRDGDHRHVGRKSGAEGRRVRRPRRVARDAGQRPGDRSCAGRRPTRRSLPERDETTGRSGLTAPSVVPRGDLQRGLVPWAGDAGDRACRRIRRSSDRRLDHDGATALGLDGSTFAITVADGSPGHRLRLPARRPLDSRASWGELAADLGRAIPPVPRQLWGRGRAA